MADKNKDLEFIKKKYGEKMSHLCRTLFPTLLETEGLLPNLLLSKFNEDKSLYDVIVDNHQEEDFKNYIYSFIDVENNNAVIVNKTPKELLAEAGYDFYECKSEKDIESFKKYYAKGEGLCTFDSNRLRTNHVFWAVKKNVNKIKRENFDKPTRQDEYGTSVISIQFSRGEKNTLSIKNRYNHKVNNCDATFGNNLDNIISGLSKSFENTYNLNVIGNQSGFELPNFVMGEDGKLYRYNQEINNVYYCPDNRIIDNGAVHSLDPSKQLLMDYFIINLSGENKGLEFYDKFVFDNFIERLRLAQKIIVTKHGDEKKVVISLDTGDVTIGLNKDNQMINLDYPQLTEADDSFLWHNNSLQSLSLSKLTRVGNRFLFNNETLQTLSLPQLTQKGDRFLYFHTAFRNLTCEQIRAQSRKETAVKTDAKSHHVIGSFKGIKNTEKSQEKE